MSASAVDDALDLFGVLMATRLVRVAQRASQKNKAADLPKQAQAGHTLAAAVAVLLAAMDEAGEDAADVGSKATLDVASVMVAIEQVAPRDRLAVAVATVEMLAPADEDDDDGAWREELVKRFGVVRQFLPSLAQVVSFSATGTGQAVLDALRELPALIGRKRVKESEIRTDLVKGSWRRLVTGNPDPPAGVIDRHAYVLCVLEALWKALRYREVYATDSKRWG
ncbi:hypothetical protein [Rhodococcus wratislaviensis]|uniref:Uncharacterized protein n=1 Tax=Rhodococcus wratislaviensis NBRC 100605 TaxID=1219028 RepID=X0PRE8_RHOWR|nr:hypothetical protein [Rhodococcus wratislaviensis]GAF45449.1 hypothetical protein RW1_022_00250 [Rhodococcus wratislaviensis NBRC 100605]